MGGIFFLAVFICAVAAAIHLRRGDPHFLIALAAPWVIFPAILTQMSARYFMLPAAMTVTMVGISVRMSLWHLLLTVMGCITFCIRQWRINPQEIAPLTYKIIRPTHPDMGWLLVAVAAVFLVSALASSRRGIGGYRWLSRKNRIQRASSPATLLPP
jgi:Ca2+/Na+ antiporter